MPKTYKRSITPRKTRRRTPKKTRRRTPRKTRRRTSKRIQRQTQRKSRKRTRHRSHNRRKKTGGGEKWDRFKGRVKESWELWKERSASTKPQDGDTDEIIKRKYVRHWISPGRWNQIERNQDEIDKEFIELTNKNQLNNGIQDAKDYLKLHSYY